MKFYSIKVLTLSLAFLGLCSVQSAFADDGSIPVDLPWVNEQVETVCPIGDNIPKVCANEVANCRDAAVNSLYIKIKQECSWDKGFAFICNSTQIKAVFSYVENVLRGDAWGHPEAIDTAKYCVATKKDFPEGAKPPKETKPKNFPLEAKLIIENYCGTPPGIENEACKAAAEQCQSKSAAAFTEVLSKVLYDNPKDCEYVTDPDGAHYECPAETIHLITTGLADRDSKEDFGKEIPSACTNIKVGGNAEGPPPPAMPGVGTDTSTPNTPTVINPQLGGGGGCALNSPDTMATNSGLVMTVIALAAAMALRSSKRKSF